MAKRKQQLAAATLMCAALYGTAAGAQMQRIERPVPQVQPIEAREPGGGLEAFALIHREPIGLGGRRGGEGLDAGWLVRLDLPPGRYLVSGNATFSRRDPAPSEGTPSPGVAVVSCEVGGLDQTVPLNFKIDPSPMHPDASRTVPFHVAGTSSSGGIFLRCSPNGEVWVSDIYINALKIDRLSVRVE